jgi:formate C-acetyltransferase
MGRATGATPDGRNAGEPISFNLSPMPGSGRNGPTSVAKSVAKLDFRLVSGGGTFDLKLDPKSFQDVAHLEALLRTYLDLGGMQIQMNVVDYATLRDAQAHPQDHRDLLVRITGYSAYFTTLSTTTQDDIIARHEHVLDPLSG